jgi:hypothetical protein
VRTPDEGFKVIKIIALTLVVQVNEDKNADPAEHEPIQPTPSALLASEPHCEKEWNNPKKDEEEDLLSAQPDRIDRCHQRPVLRLPASTSLLRAGGQVERHALPAIRPDSARYSPHDLRHRYASLKLREGVPVTDLAAQLGHARKSITLDTYSHVLVGE